jgi:hypothetical protein
MKTAAWRRLIARSVLVTFTTSAVACGSGASEPPPATTATPAEVTTTSAAPTTISAAPPTTLPAHTPPQLSKQELRELVAPVALYPDVVLASLLPATTHPDQLRDAARFVGQADSVETIPDDRGWDGSVVGLLQFPDVLRWLDANPAWTDQMGQAVTEQQGDTLDAIQDYRRSAANAGNLKSNEYQVVRAVPDRDIRIQPARPDTVYVPSYDPALATQPLPAQEGPGINPWIAFGGGAVVGALGAWALYSIFDDDDDDDYRGGRYAGRRRIRSYDNYYYARGRRPRAVEWTAAARANRPRPEGWQRPQRLQHASPSTKAARRAALRPPMTAATAQAPPPAQVRQRQEKQQVQKRQRQEKQALQKQRKKQAPRSPRQGQRKERRQLRRGERQERQGQRHEQRRQKQDQRKGQRQHKQ